jgi:hypothetical protein
MKTAKEFVDDLFNEFETVALISQEQVRMHFAQPGVYDDKQAIADFFKVRLFNERWNMVELARQVANLPVDTHPEQTKLLAKQVFDEADHFKMVVEVVEYLTGKPADLNDWDRTHGTLRPGYGAVLYGKYKAADDPLVLATYQFLVEGQSSYIWTTMTEVANDPFISKRYSKIARDERFHMNLGRMGLEAMCETAEAQEKVLKIARQIIWDLYETQCICLLPPSPASRARMREVYGEPYRELRLADI